MMKRYPQLATILILSVIAFRAHAGTLFYVPISAPGSDANSGINADNSYTSAVDGGNTSGTHRVVNEITLDALPGSGQSVTADNCTVTALSGTLTNGRGSGKIPADGVIAGALSDLIFNNGASDNSQQEIVLDPASLTPGTTYDLRVYIYNSGGQNRQVNLAFVGDGLPAAETSFFNEDDARTSAGGFGNANQVYYINYRYTWDGESTPGITITQKSGNAPFCLYALTNQEVPGAAATAAAAPAAAGAAAGGGGGEAAGAEDSEGGAGEGDEGLSSGYVNTESDEVGVESDDFYGSESLNSNGRWIKLDKWGTCWQPTSVESGWSPYTNGSWKECDDCGWTFVSEEPWAWACYHYGRWCKVRTGCGWAWVPGKVWGASWVSWRQGKTGSCGSCLGWAPLPPEAGCEINVGISSWVDYTCDIGPDCYTFVNIRDFGCCDSYARCGTCIIDRGTYINIFRESINITNICYDRNVNIYCGGPDYNWCNTEIRKQGGKECEKIYVNRYDKAEKIKGGKFSHKEGNQLGLLSPKIKNNKNAKHPKTAESVGSDKIDKGWGSVKDKKTQKELRNHLADETKGKNPKNTKGTLPPGVAEKQKKHRGEGHAGVGGQTAGQQLGGKGQKGMGKGQKGLGGPDTMPGQAGAQMGGKGKGKGKGMGQAGGVGQRAPGSPDEPPTGAAGLAGQTGGGGGKGLKPGKKFKGAGGTQPGGAGGEQAGAPGGQQGMAGQPGSGLRPGKKGKKGGGPMGAGAPSDPSQPPGMTQGGADQQLGGPDTRPGRKGKGKRGAGAMGQQGQMGAQPGDQQIGSPGDQQLGGPDTRPGKKGKGKGKMAGQAGQLPGATGQVEEGQPGQAGAGQLGGPDTRPGKKGKGKGKAQQGFQPQPGSSEQTGAGGFTPQQQQMSKGGKKGKGKQAQPKMQQGLPSTQDAPPGGAGQQQSQLPAVQSGGRGGGKKKKQQQQQMQPQQQSQPQQQQMGGGGGGGKRGKKPQQQVQPQQQYQPQQQQQMGGGGGGKRGKKQQQQFQPQQQVQPQQQQQQQQQQQGRGGGKKKRQGGTPTPAPGY